MDDRDQPSTATDKPFEDEVKHSPATPPTPDDKGDPKREREAPKTTQRTESRRRVDDLYFGYGSNLDYEDWSVFCRDSGFDPGVMRPVGPATLADEILVFDYRSARRRCGALNIRACPGGVVDGYLFAVPRDGWAALDTKEGHPHRYRREAVVVRGPTGERIAAQTYRVIPAMRVGFVAPSDHYLAVCRAGRVRYGLSLEPLDAAACVSQGG